MVCGIVAMMAVHVDPLPPHTPHASTTLPLFGTLSHPRHVVLVPLQTPVSSSLEKRKEGSREEIKRLYLFSFGAHDLRTSAIYFSISRNLLIL